MATSTRKDSVRVCEQETRWSGVGCVRGGVASRRHVVRGRGFVHSRGGMREEVSVIGDARIAHLLVPCAYALLLQPDGNMRLRLVEGGIGVCSCIQELRLQSPVCRENPMH